MRDSYLTTMSRLLSDANEALDVLERLGAPEPHLQPALALELLRLQRRLACLQREHGLVGR